MLLSCIDSNDGGSFISKNAAACHADSKMRPLHLMRLRFVKYESTARRRLLRHHHEAREWQLHNIADDSPVSAQAAPRA